MSTKEKKQKDLNVVEDDIEEIKEPSTITKMVKELKELDDEMNRKAAFKYEMSKEVIKLQIETEYKVIEQSELDSSIKYYEMKCKVLKKDDFSLVS